MDLIQFGSGSKLSFLRRENIESSQHWMLRILKIFSSYYCFSILWNRFALLKHKYLEYSTDVNYVFPIEFLSASSNINIIHQAMMYSMKMCETHKFHGSISRFGKAVALRERKKKKTFKMMFCILEIHISWNIRMSHNKTRGPKYFACVRYSNIEIWQTLSGNYFVWSHLDAH